MLKRNKKGLASGLIAFITLLLSFALITLVVTVVWTNYNSNIQDMDESIVSNSTKEDVNNLSLFVGWGDQLFMWLFIALLVGYMISAATIPPSQPVYFLLFMGFLAVIVLTTMILSNAWVVISNQAEFLTAVGDIPVTNYILTYFPTITFFVGLIGAVIFFTRKSSDPVAYGGLGGTDFE